MFDARKQWEGQVVNGIFPLIRYLGSSEHSAVFLTERHEGEHRLKAAIKLIPAAGENDDFQLSRWRQASELSHPHLISLFESGRCELGNRPLLYVLMEYAEESLAQVLSERALTDAEARSMLDPILDVLSYLHGKGLVHGHIKPTNILADGDDLKVSSDGVRSEGDSPESFGRLDTYDPPENARGVLPVVEKLASPRDVWSLGVMLVETLTQSPPTAPTAEQQDQQEPLLPPTLPEPFRDIARHCLVQHPQGRWTVSQIAARLHVSPEALPSVTPPPRRPSQPNTKPYSYTALIVGVLVLALVFVGAKLSRRHSEVPQATAVVLEPIAASPALKQEPLVPQEPREPKVPPVRAAQSFKLRAAPQWQSATRDLPVPLAASTHSEIAVDHGVAYGKEPIEIGKRPSDATIQGEVVQRVLPDVLESARNTIRGTLRVIVQVEVDRFGNVEGADLKSLGPSKYFARQALQAARLWKFKPPNVAGRNVSISWILRFEFTPDGTTVVPTPQTP